MAQHKNKQCNGHHGEIPQWKQQDHRHKHLHKSQEQSHSIKNKTIVWYKFNAPQCLEWPRVWNVWQCSQHMQHTQCHQNHTTQCHDQAHERREKCGSFWASPTNIVLEEIILSALNFFVRMMSVFCGNHYCVNHMECYLWTESVFITFTTHCGCIACDWNIRLESVEWHLCGWSSAIAHWRTLVCFWWVTLTETVLWGTRLRLFTMSITSQNAIN